VIVSDAKDGRVRQLASEILLKVDIRNAYADLLLDRTLANAPLAERDRALLTELVYGTLRWRGKIDDRLNRQLRRPLGDTDPAVRNLLRLTAYQLLFLNKIPDYAAVNEAVRLAKAHAGSKVAGFINGVLRNLLRDRDRTPGDRQTHDSIAALAVNYSHPEWLVKRWIDDFGRDPTIALMRANNEKPPLVVRVNLRKISREGLLDLFQQNAIPAHATEWSPQGVWLNTRGAISRLPGFEDGLFQVQGEASQLVGYLLEPQPKEHILDVCAAPGGKTTHIAELMGDAGQVLATDKSARGIRRIEENSARLGLQSIRSECVDMTREFTAPIHQRFDRILVDAPCSGLGTLRRHPEIKWRRQESDLARLSRLQSRILNHVADSVKSGGVLVYSTCTLTRVENADIVEEFLKRHNEFELQDSAGYLPAQAEPLTQGHYFLALPNRHNTDGFFAARMRKVA
jgi:16S rRNA (cytosine967-C5)-methyltransferase